MGGDDDAPSPPAEELGNVNSDVGLLVTLLLRGSRESKPVTLLRGSRETRGSRESRLRILDGGDGTSLCVLPSPSAAYALAAETVEETEEAVAEANASLLSLLLGVLVWLVAPTNDNNEPRVRSDTLLGTCKGTYELLLLL